MNIQIKGIASASQFLKNTSKETFDKANKAIIKAGFFIEGEVKQSIAGRKAEPRSVDTGRFINSVKNVQNKPLTSTIATNVEYAKHLEYGTSRMRARKHFRNTAARNEKKVKNFVETEIKKI